MDSIAPGSTLIVHWEQNQHGRNANAVKSNRIEVDGKNLKTKKIILPEDESAASARPGEVWVCRVIRVTSKSETHGAIFVRPISRKLDFNFKDVWVDPIKAQVMATVLQDRRLNLMLQGEQGIGKTTTARAIAAHLGWEFRKVSGGLMKKFVYMLGRFVPNARGATLKWIWSDSKLVAVIKEAGANPDKTFLLMIDEYTRIDEDARDALLDVIEGNERVLTLSSGEDVIVPQNLVFMAAGNVGEGFTIRQQDAAAIDRWVVVPVEVMPQPQELEHCYRLYPTVDRKVLERALTAINTVRSKRKSKEARLSKTISTRGAEKTASLLADGHSLDIALEYGVISQYSGSVDDEHSEAATVQKIITEALANV